MIITTDDLRVKLDRFDKIQNQVLEHYVATHDQADCRMINAMYYQLSKAINCLEKGLKGEFDFE